LALAHLQSTRIGYFLLLVQLLRAQLALLITFNCSPTVRLFLDGSLLRRMHESCIATSGAEKETHLQPLLLTHR
jgi:hypothetical protein